MLEDRKLPVAEYLGETARGLFVGFPRQVHRSAIELAVVERLQRCSHRRSGLVCSTQGLAHLAGQLI
jgi:hypothetical protein